MNDRSQSEANTPSSDNGADGPDLALTLRERMAGFSRLEQSLAGYMLDNLQTLPFETGASIAQSVGVSEMTVSRFIRTLGFESLRDLKRLLRNQLNESDSEVDDHLGRFQTRRGEQDTLHESLRLELDAIVNAYSLATTELWDEAATLLTNRPIIYVIGFQASQGLAMDFASRLLWARPNVVFIPNASGTFGEVITADPQQSVVVLVDTASYSTRCFKLAERLKAMGMPLVIVTDKFTHWGYAFSHLVFEGRTYVKTFWDSTASLGVILNLMVDSVATKLGPQAQQNFARMSEMGVFLDEFADPARMQHRK